MEISRSEQKRRVKQVEQLVRELSALSAGHLKSLPCSDEIKELLQEVSSLKGGAQQRQLKYITKLLKNESLEELYAFLAQRRGSELQQKQQFHELEFFRDQLVEEALEYQKQCAMSGVPMEENWPGKVVSEIASVFPVEKMVLLRLARQFAVTRNVKYKKELFRVLRAAQEASGYEKKAQQ